jgi:hypothetical protein
LSYEVSQRLKITTEIPDREIVAHDNHHSLEESALLSQLMPYGDRVVELYDIPRSVETYELHFLLRSHVYHGYRMKATNHKDLYGILILFKTSEDGKFHNRET